MPPKAKFSKSQIIDAALNIVRQEGASVLTARALGASLGSSARPVFTVFENMDEVQQSVINAAKALYKKYVDQGLQEIHPFKGVGTQYILFSINEPKLFQLLFMSENKEIPDLSNVLLIIDDSYEKILLSVCEEYKLDKSSAERLYQHLWIYTHGIATLCATGMCKFKADEISVMMTEVFKSLLITVKGRSCNDSY